MNKYVRLLTTAMVAAAMVVMSAASAFAMGNGTGEIDYEKGVVRAVGMGVMPPQAVNLAQGKILARRAAIVDGWRQLAETVKGVQIDSDTTVEMNMTTSDVVKAHMSATIKGARVVSESFDKDGAYTVTMEVPMFGVTSSIAKAVLPQPTVKEPFPQPVASVAPAPAPSTSVNVEVKVNTQTPQQSQTPAAPQQSAATPAAPSVPASSAAPAPVGQAVGNYTGLIVDCRGLGLRPVMSPVIKNAEGNPIYGYKNLNYDLIVKQGMASYTSDMGQAARAGSNPLVVKAVSLDNHNGNPVLSTADANRVLIENGATHFLDNTSVVFVR
ncbi:MAG: LPP20 family lipoprotein [Selenomonas sp.]|nr:LPP20 family lipoprotein [Selenomonas sp.]